MLGLLLAAVSARADVTLNAIFDDHIVLQRDIPVSVYGTAEPGEKVTVAFAGQTKSVTADKDGAWRVKLAAMKASTNSAVMTVTGSASPEGSATASKNKIVIEDVVVGDVWICSGQSNMEWVMKQIKAENDVAKAKPGSFFMRARIGGSMSPTEEGFLAGNETRENPHEQTNTLFPALRPGHRLFQRPSPQRQIPGISI